MGLAVHKPREAEDNFAVIYYPPAPRAVIEIVDPDDPEPDCCSMVKPAEFA